MPEPRTNRGGKTCRTAGAKGRFDQALRFQKTISTSGSSQLDRARPPERMNATALVYNYSLYNGPDDALPGTSETKVWNGARARAPQ